MTLGLDILTLLIVVASFKAIRDNRKQSQEAIAEGRRQSQAALDVAHEQMEQSKQQAQLERFAENRPLLMPIGIPTFQDDKPQWLNWNVNEQTLAIHNIGSGVALNVASVMYGCESYLIDWTTNQRSDQTKGVHWTCWLGVPAASNTTEKAIHKKGNGIFYEKNMHIGQYSFNAPQEPRVVPNQNQPFITARITITYLDIFRRKHASIFDYVQHTGGWQLVEFLEDINEDLYGLEG